MRTSAHMHKLASCTVPGLVSLVRKVVENEEEKQKEKQMEAAAAGAKWGIGKNL